MKNRWLHVILMVLIAVGYVFFIRYYENTDRNTAPEIVIQEKHLEISVNDGEDVILKGVRAYDETDGDLTKEIIVDSISEFDQEQKRTIKYVVFDRENKAATATRTISYTDYVAPELKLTDSLVINTLSVSKINQLAGAFSCVDGDISSKVNIKIGVFANNMVPVSIVAKDSTGTETTLNITCDYDPTRYMAKIELEQYLLRFPVGSDIDLKSNVKTVIMAKTSHPEYKDQIVVQTNMDPTTPGVYEVYYYLTQNNTSNAYAKSIVVIE